MKKDIFGPSLTKRERTQFDDKPWNPRKPCDIHNPYPVEKWPFKPNAKVFFVFSRTVLGAGRVTWYHPSRKIDHDCCVTPGKPFFNIRCGMSYLPPATDVFPGTKRGWLAARSLIFDNLVQAEKQEEADSIRRIQGIKESMSELAARKCPV